MMAPYSFTPTEQQVSGIQVPYFEEARADYAPYYRSEKRIIDAQQEVVLELSKLGAGGAQFIEGYFGDVPKRYGYELRFSYMGGTGRIQVAGLPFNAMPTTKKIVQVRVQALLNVRDWLKAAVTAQVFSPGSYPLIQFLLVNPAQTLAEAAIEARGLPEMNPRLTGGVE